MLTYTLPRGIHSCLDVVAKSKHFSAGGVLIRALYPLIGTEIMKQNRKTSDLKNLTDGPAKLTHALDIDKKLYGTDLTQSNNLFISEWLSLKNKIIASPRIGITKAVDTLWNFKLKL